MLIGIKEIEKVQHEMVETCNLSWWDGRAINFQELASLGWQVKTQSEIRVDATSPCGRRWVYSLRGDRAGSLLRRVK